jgi:hypothetical protein
VIFGMCATTKILSLCYETDAGDDVATTNEQLDNYVNITYPRRSVDTTPSGGTSSSGTGGTGTTGGATTTPAATPGSIVATAGPDDSWIAPGPAPLSAFAFGVDTPGIVPGFVYRLTVRTENTRLRENATGAQRRTYYALFQVRRPPSDLAPYVLDNFPDESGFPHYRVCEHYVRFSRNYVHKLMGDLNEDIEVCLLVNGDATAPRSTLPFRDGADADLLTLLAPSADEKKGWGWGKANDHLTTTEEQTWIEAFNRTAPPGEEISALMALPDDMLWAYLANPVRLRSEFDEDSTDTIAGFSPPMDGAGAATPGRWSTSDALLQHGGAAASSSVDSSAPGDSFLLSFETFAEGTITSVWIRPHVIAGHVSVIMAADVPAVSQLAHHFALQLDLSSARVLLLDVTPGIDPTQRVLGERRFEYVADRWYRAYVRVAMVSGSVAVTALIDDQQLFSVSMDYGTLAGHVGLGASADYIGSFDNFEVLSINRLNKLPEPGVANQLSIIFKEDDQGSEIYRHPFTPSLYLDLFDHLNSWDRRVQRAPSGPLNTGCDPDPALRLPDADGVTRCALTASITSWETGKIALLTALGDVYDDKRQYALKLRTLADVDATRQRLRDARYDLDVAFEDLAGKLGFDLATQPTRLEFILANESRGLLLQSPEPIDWTRITAGQIRRVDVADDGTRTTAPLAAKILYSSDFTRAILLLTQDGTTIDQFDPATTYLWTIKQNFVLPPNLVWLTGWVTHRKETHVITLEIPTAAL